MNQKQKQQLVQLFNNFAQEEQASSFAVENLFNKTLKVLSEKDSSQVEKINKS